MRKTRWLKITILQMVILNDRDLLLPYFCWDITSFDVVMVTMWVGHWKTSRWLGGRKRFHLISDSFSRRKKTIKNTKLTKIAFFTKKRHVFPCFFCKTFLHHIFTLRYLMMNELIWSSLFFPSIFRTWRINERRQRHSLAAREHISGGSFGAGSGQKVMKYPS